jgi:hypothetical protein
VPDSKYDLDLDSAWKRTLRRAHIAEVPDIMRWDDHKLAWPATKAQLIEELDSDTYEPATQRVVDVPKNEFTTRPMALLEPRDHTVYEAAVGAIAPTLDGLLSPSPETRLPVPFSGSNVCELVNLWC